jgi:uncharacterized protein
VTTPVRPTDPGESSGPFADAGAVNGCEFRMPCIFVVRLRDGRIVESRDYSDHVALARAFGRLDALAAALAAQAD